MADLIDRQAAIATAVRAALDWHRLANPMYSIAYCIGEAMRELPSADTVEVVRCKDCKHNSLKRVSGNAFCDLGIGLSQIYDFCSYGERADG